MLITCPECGKQISDQAAACPHCGRPMRRAAPTAYAPQPARQAPKKERGKPFWIWLVIGVIALACLTRCGSGGGRTSGSSSAAKSSYSSSSSSAGSKKSYTEADYKSATYTLAQEQVKAHLKAPSTASFCRMSETEFSKKDSDQYVMSGWVDAENSFGAKLRSSWEITVQVKGEKIVMLTLTIDGKTAYP